MAEDTSTPRTIGNRTDEAGEPAASWTTLPNELRSIRLQGCRRIDRALNFSALWLGRTYAKTIPTTLVGRLDLIVRGAWCHEVCDVSYGWQGAAWRGGLADGSCAGWSGAEGGHGEGRSGLRRGTRPRSGE